tara:strand:+ start:4826 stop:5563 length:738 start_codon:yes stop_codon:yes gene_type:complete
MKYLLKNILIKFSYLILLFFRVVKYIIPKELHPKRKKTKLELKLEDNLAEETFNTFKEYFKKSVLFTKTSDIREYAIRTALTNDPQKEFFYLEFGVWKGTSANLFSKYVNKLYAFDSFEGLREDWVGTAAPKGNCNLNKKIPKLNSNVEPVVGWIEDTLDIFLKKHNPKINFVHIDVDTYGTTKFILEKLKPYLVENAIIAFDELYNYIGWEHGEYKALNEVFRESEYEYRAFTVHYLRAVIQLK